MSALMRKEVLDSVGGLKVTFVAQIGVNFVQPVD
jgi:hypothetical protein